MFEKNADLDVSEDFKIFWTSPNEKNTDLNVTEDFKIFDISDPPI